MNTDPLDCPFCNLNCEVLLKNEYSFAIYDKYPVSEGHVLVIPRVHVADFFSLDSLVREQCFEMVGEVKRLLDERFSPDGYNVGVNIEEAAGQTIGHVHFHVIPRYRGDVEDPTGGVRNVIPGKGNYRDS